MSALPVRYLSVCSGVEAASVAWEPLGWRPVAFAELAPFPAAVLAHRFPLVRNLGDLLKIDGSEWRGKTNVLVGGTPCQAFSMGGRRHSLADPRGRLTLSFVELCDEIDPEFTLWENVPGVLSTSDGAFGCFLGALCGEDVPLVPPGKGWANAGFVLGPRRRVAWRVLDARGFGTPQGRRRVFVLACPRDGADPREVLFERRGSGGLPSTGGEAEQDSSAAVRQGPGGDDSVGTEGRPSGIPYRESSFSAWAEGFGTLRAAGGGLGGGSENLIVEGDRLRKFTPREAERLQGFPDDWTLIPWKGKPAEECPDGPRWKAMGNSMAVPVMRWLGTRMDAVLRGKGAER
jgi:DNA (cytosine-5)-methyltransferase 1